MARWFALFAAADRRLPELRRNRRLLNLAGGISLMLVADSHWKAEMDTVHPVESSNLLWVKQPLVRLAVLLGLIWALVVVLPIPWLDTGHYSAYAAGLQAFGIVTAFLVGAIAIYFDGRDRRVDRVYALHQELTIGELDDARRRLDYHLRKHSGTGPFLRRYSPGELRFDSTLNHYDGPQEGFTPASDLGLLLRFFERARLVREAGSAHDAVFAELIGRHAGWWNCAIKNEDRKSRKGLMELAKWADNFANKNHGRYDFLKDWGDTRRKDFGSLDPWTADPE